VEGGQSPETDDLLQWLLFVLGQKDQGFINDLQIMYMVLDRAFELFPDQGAALRAATNVTRPGGVPGLEAESPYLYTNFTLQVLGKEVFLGSTGFGGLSDGGDQVSHFIGEAYVASVIAVGTLAAHIPSTRDLVFRAAIELQERRRPQAQWQINVDVDLGLIAGAFVENLNGGMNTQDALMVAYTAIQNYDYAAQHPGHHFKRTQSLRGR
jgi:hypothetical protein